MAILITGANRGIGRALYDGYAKQGADVIGTTRGDAPASGHWQTLEAADPTSHAALVDRLGDTPLDLLICNAGVYLDKGEALEGGYPGGLWADTFAVNVTGVFLTVQTMLDNLMAAKTPKVAIIASQMGSSERASGGSYIYRASKAAAVNLGRNLALDLRPVGIAVGIYHPGWVRTDMGGSSATVDVRDSAAGLMSRFEALSLETTGVFEDWTGAMVPF